MARGSVIDGITGSEGMAPVASEDDATGWAGPSGTSTSLLAELSADTRAALLAASTRVYVSAGQWVFRQGDTADAMYILESGRVEVLNVEDPRAPDGTVLRVLGPGSSIGEIALLTRSARSASARARRDSVLLRLDVAAFEALLTASPALTLALTRAMGRWLTHASWTTARHSRMIVLAVTSPNPRAPLRSLAEQMVRALRSLNPSLDAAVVTGEEARSQVPDTDLVNRAFGVLLDRWETQHDVVILSAEAGHTDDPGARAWTDFCLRSADRAVVAIGPADPASAWADSVERMRSHLPGPPDLCFLNTREPSLVAGWLDALPPRAHHLVRTGTTPDAEETVGRMIRRLTGRSVGVVLSGGGARGFAHHGILAAFRAARIPVDRIGGCSIGAVIGALFAAGHSVEVCVEICRRFFVRSNPLNDYVLPRTALLGGRKLSASLRAAFGSDPIEALPIPFFCVSADLVQAETIVHERGMLWRAVLASVSIPGLLPPVPVGNRVLVDGGVLNNLPVDVMADAQEGPVVAVDVMRPFNPTGDRLPLIAEVLARVSVLGSWRSVETNRTRAAHVITVPDDRTGMLDWSRLDAVVEAGRRAGEAALAGGVAEALRAGQHPPSADGPPI